MKLLRAEVIAILSLLIWLIGAGPLKPYRKAVLNKNSPELILVLGGDVDRERVGLDIANDLNLPLLLSGGSNPEHAKWLVKKSGIPLNRVTLDYRAKDTLTNFTSIVDELVLKQISHALLITSEDHLPRAAAVGNIVAGSRGIKLTTIPVSCFPECKKESIQKNFFDLVRAITWVATGKDPKEITKKAWQNF